MDKLDPTSLSTTPFPRPVSFLSKHSLAPAWGSQEKKKKKNLLLGLLWFSARLLGESGGKEGRARGARDVPSTDIPGSAGAVWRVLSTLPRSRSLPAGGSPLFSASHLDPARLARGRASAVQLQRGPHCCLATRRMDLKGPGTEGTGRCRFEYCC